MKRKEIDKGASTVEYALLVLVAAALAGALLTIAKSEAFHAALSNLMFKAFE